MTVLRPPWTLDDDPYVDVPPPDGPPDGGAERIRRSWQRIDLDPILDGSYQPPLPTVGARRDGAGLLYPGRLHTIASESEGGKTWFALIAVRHELDAGNAVMFLDFEDDGPAVVGRLLALEVDPRTIRDRFAYIRPEDAIGAFGNREDLADVLGDLAPTLAVLDGVTEAMVLHGLEMRDNTGVARFGQLLPRWVADRGPACVALDHVVKDRENRGRYAIGGVHKLNGVNGAAYVLDNRSPFGIGIIGRSRVLIAKDRPGQLRRYALASGGMHWYADLILESHDDRTVDAYLRPPEEHTEDFRPTAVMAKIAAALEKCGPLSAKKIETAVTGRATTIRQALGFLKLDGYVSDSSPHELLKPYPEGEKR